MSTAPRSAAQQHTRPRFTPDIQQIERYLFDAHGDNEGLIEVFLGKTRRTDPSKIDAFPPQPAWKEGHRFRVYNAATRPQIACDLAKLIRKYGNVYISRALYSSPQRDAKYALPSDNIFVDDVDPSTDVSILVQTSEESYQAIIKLSTKEDAATIRELGERIAKAVTGTKGEHADKCYDVTHLIRVPTGYNTKHYKNFQARVVSKTGKTFRVDELRAHYPEVERKAPEAADLNWKEAEHCYNMLDDILKRIKKNSFTYQQLHGDGKPDRSNTRFSLACNLRKDFGYPNEEIAAILYKLHFGHLEEKGSDWLEGDINRCIAEANRLYPDAKINVSYCRLSWQTKPVEPLPQVERPKTGRRPILTDDAYFALLEQDAINGKALGTQEERARELGISVGTIRRKETRLKQAGKGERITVRKRGGTYSFFALFSAIKTPERVDIKDGQNTGLVRSTTSERAQQHAENRETPTVVGVTHPPDRARADAASAPAAAVRLADAARAALESLPGRPSSKGFVEAFRTFFPHIRLSADRLHQVYTDTLEARRRERTIERETAKVQTAAPDELRRWVRSYAWHHLEARKRGNERQAYVWGCKAQIVEEEIERRQKAGEWPPERRRRTRRAAMLDIPPALFEPDLAPPAQKEDLSGACVSPPQPSNMPQPACLETLRRLLADPAHIPAVERYMQKYPGFDYDDVPVRIAQLRASQRAKGG